MKSDFEISNFYAFVQLKDEDGVRQVMIPNENKKIIVEMIKGICNNELNIFPDVLPIKFG